MGIGHAPRNEAVAGKFYPGDPEALRSMVQSFLDRKPDPLPDLGGQRPLAAMVPHAGYVFSGSIAGMTLGLTDIPARIVLLGPNHTGRGQPVSLWTGGEWLSPLGSMGVDPQMAVALLNADAGFAPDAAAHASEHSLEVILPFLQVKNPHALISPVTVGTGDLDALRLAGQALAAAIRSVDAEGGTTLIVVSSDMSHYLPHEQAAAQDATALKALTSLDPEHFYRTVRDNRISMCGVYPMTLALYALKDLGATRAAVPAYATSGQTGRSFGADMKRVVGYAGALFA